MGKNKQRSALTEVYTGKLHFGKAQKAPYVYSKLLVYRAPIHCCDGYNYLAIQKGDISGSSPVPVFYLSYTVCPASLKSEWSIRSLNCRLKAKRTRATLPVRKMLSQAVVPSLIMDVTYKHRSHSAR